MKNFITPKELHTLQAQGNLVIIDVRGKGPYEAGHIEGALALDVERDLTKPVEAHGGRHPLPTKDNFAETLRRLGLTITSTVVIYDDWMTGVGRLWWMLRYAGIENVKVLAGGIGRWQREGYPLTQAVTPNPAPSSFVPQWRENWLVSHDEVVALTASQEKILVDVRAPERYRGEVEPLDPVAGHIPTAINIYYELPYTADGLKPEAELREIFKPLFNSTKKTVLYCGSGITAPIEMLAVDELNIPVALYLGSFSDWISYENAVIATGTETMDD